VSEQLQLDTVSVPPELLAAMREAGVVGVVRTIALAVVGGRASLVVKMKPPKGRVQQYAAIHMSSIERACIEIVNKMARANNIKQAGGKNV